MAWLPKGPGNPRLEGGYKTYRVGAGAMFMPLAGCSADGLAAGKLIPAARRCGGSEAWTPVAAALVSRSARSTQYGTL